QGIGLGFIFVPLSTVAFSTLAQRYRNEGTAMFSLVRNIGSSIGISLFMSLLGQRTQGNHAALVEHLTPFREALREPWCPQIWDWTSSSGAAALNAEVTRQAAMLAYLDDFRFMMLVTVLAAPLLLLIRAPVKRLRAP